MPTPAYIALIPLLPLAGFFILGLFGRKYFKASSGIVATGLLLISTVLSLYVGYHYFFVDGKPDGVYQPIVALEYTWLQFSPKVSIDMSIVLDPISVMMIIVVSFVSLMVHIFSLGYMKGEERFAVYYAFLSLFTFSMLGLVLSGNIFQIYIFWELVGVSSYLLIGYYFNKPAAVAASKKAFIVTRLADIGFLIGILILAFHAETLDFSTLIGKLTSPSPELTSLTTTSFMGISFLTWGLTLVFMGGAGKSAMFPLHIWLPDAMEGPTPVSALIHAATMVVAGVYLVARIFPIFAISGPAALEVVMYTGAFSSLLAAIIACTQTDIKRVLAYSTMSQIGYMMFALGVSGYGGENGLGYTASMFHLFTHAFFKSLLFLCAGAVIHLVHSNEMKDMGGLRKFMPITHVSFLIACLAIAGIPPFSGFFSKEEILLAAYQSSMPVYIVGLFTSGLTAFYMFRLYFSIFWNKESQLHQPYNEGTLSMKIPLIVLAIATVSTGFVPFSTLVTPDGKAIESHVDIVFSIAPVSLALAGILFAAFLYKKENQKPVKIASSLGGLYHAVHKKFYIDEIYLFITKKIIFNLIGRPAAWVDRNIVDGLMNLLATFTGRTAELIKGIQSGKIQNYTLYFFGGVVGLVFIFIYLW
ncbi:MAG: NADH-quinone oxidoreductase subunit L [Chitinophagaceae bacterium]|nr:NADH-quinone oxidoreductase subunit L [Chitinophagaceae bacterium]